MLQYVIKNMYCCRMFLTGSRSAQFDTSPVLSHREQRKGFLPACLVTSERNESHEYCDFQKEIRA